MNVKQINWFAGIYVLSCAASLAAAVAINVIGNGADAFPSSRFPAMSPRAWKTRRLEEAVRDGRPPKVIILGSSRVMDIEPKYVQAITGKTTFNYAVYSATPTDYLTQLRYLLRIGCRPETVVLGVDEWAFYYTYWYSGMDLGHLGLFREMPFPESLNIFIRSLCRISLGTTRQSLLNLIRKKQPAPSRIDKSRILLEDGYLIFAEQLRKTEDGSFDLAANIADGVSDEHIKRILQESLERPNPIALERFKEFVSLARAEGIEVRVMFLPLHPDFERQRLTGQLLKGRTALGRELESICTERGVVFRDFTNLAAFDGDRKEFYDGWHQTPINTRKMINALFGVSAKDVLAEPPADSETLKHLPPVTTLTTE